MAKTKEETIEKPEVDPVRAAKWQEFCDNMQKWDKARFERLKEAGELDEIPEGFTY